MYAFNAANRCPICGGDATFKYHRPAHGCDETVSPHMHRRCEDCGFSWLEAPALAPLEAISRATG
jgi:hypothetical protein